MIQRNDVVVLYGVSGTYTDEILHYEVCRIQIRNDKYGHREVLPSNEQFGKDGSQAILDQDDALKYFCELTASIKSSEKALNNVKSSKENLWLGSDIFEMSLSTPDSENQVSLMGKPF